jgi:hypothetical protein
MIATAAALLLALGADAPAAYPFAERPGAAADAPPGVPSLLAAPSLRGGSGALAWAGFSSLGIAYGQGVTLQDDLGVQADLDWTSTEATLGAFWKRPLGDVGGWQLAGRLRLAWYLDFGARWIHDSNRGDRGFVMAPALITSVRAGDGVVSLTGELPLTVTGWRGGGFLAKPRVSAAYEAPLYGSWTLGISAGLTYRGGGGGAPMRGGQLSPELLVLAGYRVF